MSVKITGEVTRHIFINSDNNYRIFVVSSSDGNLNTLCGYIPSLEEGLTYEFLCEETYHPRYGNQFKVLSYQSVMDNSKEGIISYLSSNLFPGVGLICAEKVYDTLGEDCLELIEKNPAVLDEVKGITKNQKETIYLKILENRIVEKTFVRLYQMGLSSKMVMELYEKYHENTLEIIEENPYRLIYDLDGVGFKKADELAMKLEFPLDHSERLKALLVYTMRNVCNVNSIV
jgi:exodeoxyribonuclease V alpha subunit